MLLLLEESIRRTKGSDKDFFSAAYYWRFKKQVDVAGDVLAYRTQRIIPPYIKDYLRHVYDI